MSAIPDVTDDDSRVEEVKVTTTTRDDKKLRAFYNEYCEAVRQSKEAGSLNVLDILVTMNFLTRNGRNRYAVATSKVANQNHKFSIDLRSQMETEDFVKNLFKLLCGVLNMTLKQRG